MPPVSLCLNAGAMGRIDAESETLIPIGGYFGDAYAIQSGALRENPSSGPQAIGVQRGVAYTIESRAEVQCVAHSLRAGGFDASEDGTGRGTPLVPIAFGWQNSSQQGASASAEIAPTLDKSKTPAVAFAQNQLGEVRTGDVFSTINTNSNASGRNTPLLHQAMGVRRLTPRECERLQGFPDDYTAIPGAADGPRYKALGNSFAVNVVRWIGLRIQQVENLEGKCTTAKAAA